MAPTRKVIEMDDLELGLSLLAKQMPHDSEDGALVGQAADRLRQYREALESAHACIVNYWETENEDHLRSADDVLAQALSNKGELYT